MVTAQSQEYKASLFNADRLTLDSPIANQFFMYIDRESIPWDIYSSNQENRGFAAYFSQILQTVDAALPNQGLVFYITVMEMQELPSYGNNVFVLILGDEFYRVPSYIDKVGGVFKCYGTRQLCEQLDLYRPLLKPTYFKFLMFAQAIKNLAYRLVYKLKYNLKRIHALLFKHNKLAPIYDIPPGYYNTEDLPFKPIEQRTYDVLFDGSVSQCSYPIWSLKYWTKTPKAYSREQMVSNLEDFKTKNPQFQVQLKITSSFADTNDGEAGQSSYNQNMMNAKICLVPRGTTLETCRLFEAMRYGCVIIVESLPHRWFYEGAPIIQIGHWQNLEPTLNTLLNHPQLLNTLHKQTMEWWKTKCSEQAVGTFIAEQINSLHLRL